MGGSAIASVRRPFRALVTTFVPESTELSEASWLRGEALVEALLARRPRGMRRQVGLFVRLLDAYATLRCGRPLARLAPARRLALVRSLQDSRLRLLRRGIWGLRTLAFVAYYGQPEVRASIGYRAGAAGWGALAGGTARPDGRGAEGGDA